MSPLWTKRRHNLFALVLLLAVVGVAVTALALSPQLRDGAQAKWRGALEWAGFAGNDHADGAVYWCPMDPQIKRANPNEVCPICNMALVPLEGGEREEAPKELVLTPRQVQQAGVVTRPVIRRSLAREIDTTGRLDYDERLYRTVTSWVKGKSRIEVLRVKFVGDFVAAGKVVAEIYSPELITAQQEYLNVLGGRSSLVEATRQKLEYWGMTPAQIEELAGRREVWDRIPIHAPISGTVIERHVQEGQYIEEGQPLFRLADLSDLWVLADIYEEELQFVKVGQNVNLFIRGYPRETFKGTVAFIDPMVQPKSRTVRVRINIGNEGLEPSGLSTGQPQWKLKPGMYARVQFQTETNSSLAVPENAVLWSGRRTVVIVKEGEGRFQPREVRLGQKWLYLDQDSPRDEQKLDFGGWHQRYHEVEAGLAPGEAVVTEGAFLLNAESQFQSVLTRMLPPESARATLEEAMGKEVAERTRDVLDGYFKLSRSLAEDKLGPAVEHAAALVKTNEALARQAEKADVPKLAGRADQLGRLAKDLSRDVNDLREARVRFGRISRNLVQLLADHGGKAIFGADVFLFECGMAKVGYERWLSWSPEILNPYMGQRMLH